MLVILKNYNDARNNECKKKYSQSTTNKMERCTMYLLLQDALHVSNRGFPSIIGNSKLHLQRQVWVWLCRCSFELLMMDGKTCLKHVERLAEINKLCNVAPCWLYSENILATCRHMNVIFTDNEPSHSIKRGEIKMTCIFKKFSTSWFHSFTRV